MAGSPMDDALRSTPDMDGGLPEIDRLAMERTRARVEQTLFGKADPARLGRYEIREPIAGGGMGLVYEAYDPDLDRKVALKIVHPHRNDDARSRQRLIIEARALAKLDHPNVVKVHDVEHDSQVVIVMERVEGQTLADWEAEARRTWREVLAVYLQAGDGLAATHGVDVIHRDFKPSNAIIGADGRVRVLDFGLARLASTREDGPGRRQDASVDLTSTGDVVGTLAYSAPEQLEGGVATAASDQFSFCVSLHRAIEGVSPFEGATQASRLASIRGGPIRYADDSRRVPLWLRTAIARGLSADPARRYPSMNHLLAELRRPHGWQRWRLAVLAAGVMVVTAVAMVAASGLMAEAPCDGDATELAQVWGRTQRDRVTRAIDRIATPYARDVRDRAIATLDGYGTEWSGAHRAACRAHQRGATSALLFDRQRVCLSQRLGDLRAAVDVLSRTDAASVI
ncbi:MAG TPA: serine/threonine-protein kinase, partial [Kofleriaceae bacterium]